MSRRDPRPRYYKLIDRLAVPVGMWEWALWFETADREVSRTVVGSLEVSTAFVGLDHNFWAGDPLLFETMVFGTEALGHFASRYCQRHHTWDEAERGHAEAVAWAKECLECAGVAVGETHHVEP